MFDGDKAFQRLAELCEDPEAILLHPATRSIDRKEVVRCLVDKVILEICTPKVVQLRIVWSSGEPDEVIEVLRWGYALERIEAADAEERSNEDVLQELNDLGVLNRKLLPYKLSTVAHARWAFRQQRRRQGRGREVGSREERS